MRKSALFSFILSILFCILTACASEAKPKQPPSLPPNVVVPYIPEGEGTKDLYYNDHWRFCIQEYEPEPYWGDGSGAASLICHDLTTGEEWTLDELGYGSRHPNWDRARLYPFTDILGCDGFIFTHGGGPAHIEIDFYKVTDSGSEHIVKCMDALYTVDLDGDGQPELLNGSYNDRELELYWTNEEQTHIICSCSLNKTARDYLELSPGTKAGFNGIQEETGEVVAYWENAGVWESRTLDIVSLWKWEKARPEFWNILPFLVEDGRMLTLRLRETRAWPGDAAQQDSYRVEEVQVYDGDLLIQTILPDELTYYDGSHLFEGLFDLYTGSVPGKPDIRDFTFDGYTDLGLMGSSHFPQNVPYCYFPWDPEAGRFSTDFFILFSPLELDEENRLLIEGVAGEGFRYYRLDETGHPVRVGSAA